MRPTRTLTLAVLFSLVFWLVADDAESQRRRRRPQRAPQPTQEPAEPAEEPGAGGDEGDLQDPEASDEPSDASEPVAPPIDPLADLPDVGPVRAEFEALMNELVETRSRIAVLGRQLFQTRVRVTVQDRSGDSVTLERLDLRLDGAPIFDAERDLEGIERGRKVFEGFAAPGPHVLSISLEQRARADDAFRYTQDDTFRFQVVRGRLTDITVVLDDDSDIARRFARGGEGRYDVRVRVRVASRGLERE